MHCYAVRERALRKQVSYDTKTVFPYPPCHRHNENKKTDVYRVTTSLRRLLTKPASASTTILCRCNRRNLLYPNPCRLRYTARKPYSADSSLHSSQHTECSLERIPLPTLFVVAFTVRLQSPHISATPYRNHILLRSPLPSYGLLQILYEGRVSQKNSLVNSRVPHLKL